MADLLRSYEEFTRSLRCYDWLDGAVPGATDFDLVIERAGHFLVLEAKPWTGGVVVPWGQHRALVALSCLPNFDVWLVGEDSEDALLRADYSGDVPWTLKQGKRYAYFPKDRFTASDRAGLRQRVQEWWSGQG